MSLIQTIELPFNTDCLDTHEEENGNFTILCGMYELKEEKRVGAISSFKYENNQLKALTSVETHGIFDMKCIENSIGVACANGIVGIYDLDLILRKNIQVLEQDKGHCLSLDWQSSLIATSTSTGEVYLMDMKEDKIIRSWQAHKYPHDSSPAEIWTVGFGKGSFSNMIITGADDGYMKLWDYRETPEKPQISIRKSAHNDLGVCCYQFHPSQEFTFVTGGYDGYIRFWDIRNIKSAIKSSPNRLGGGVWRLNVSKNGKILAACMRGGFRIVNDEDFQEAFKYTQAPDEKWEDLAYGVSWIGDKRFVGCSFYDRKLRLFQL